MKFHHYFPAMVALITSLTASAQGRDQELADPADDRYLPVVVQVTENGGKASQLNVTLFKDNTQVIQLPPSKRGAFQVALDLDSYYTIIVGKGGYRDKLIHVDTHLPEGVERYEAFSCNINLEPAERFAHSDPFYLDFPGAVIRWDSEEQTFEHSGRYLADIQLKMALLSAQIESQ